MTVQILDPTTEVSGRRIAYVPRPKSLHGLRVGLIDNTKSRARDLLDNWAESRTKFVKVFPNEYKRALGELAAKAKAPAAAPAKKARAAAAK